MKLKNILTITLLFLLLTTPAFAYSGGSKVAVNPAGFLLGILGAEYEGKLSNSNSYLLSLEYVGVSDGYDSLHAFGFGGGTRYYPQGQALQGFYVEGKTNVALLSLTEGNVKGTGLAIALNGAGGYQWITRMNLAIDLGFGVSIPVFSGATATDGQSSASDGSLFGTITPTIKFGLGYVW